MAKYRRDQLGSRAIEEAEAIGAELGRYFSRAELRLRAKNYILALLGDAERKNAWQLAEAMGERREGVQHLLLRAQWHADAIRDALILYATKRFGHEDGVLVFTEAAFPKKGTESAAVARQHVAADLIENCQIAAFLGYVSPHGRLLIDRELVLPPEWNADRDRCRRAGIPDHFIGKTKVDLASEFVVRALSAGLPVRWAAAGQECGEDASFRKLLQKYGIGYVFERGGTDSDARLAAREFEASTAGEQGAWRMIDDERDPMQSSEYEWATVPHRPHSGQAFIAGSLLRRRTADKRDIKQFVCGGPQGTAPVAWPNVAEAMSDVAACIAVADGYCGLGGYEVRSWMGWRRHVTLSMWAFAALMTAAARQTGNDLGDGN